MHPTGRGGGEEGVREWAKGEPVSLQAPGCSAEHTHGDLLGRHQAATTAEVNSPGQRQMPSCPRPPAGSQLCRNPRVLGGQQPSWKLAPSAGSPCEVSWRLPLGTQCCSQGWLCTGKLGIERTGRHGKYTRVRGQPPPINV